MGIEDRDYFREKKFSWVTGELIPPKPGGKPLQPLKPVPINPEESEGAQMGIQDRDYVRERKLDYRSKYDGKSVPGPYNEGDYPKTPTLRSATQQPPDIPIWVILLSVIAAFCAAFWVLGHLR